MKKWLWIIGAVLLVLVVAVVIALSLIDLDDYKETLLVRAEEALQRDVEIGHASFVFWPGVGLRLEGLNVQDDPDFSEGRFFSAKDLVLRLRLLPLLGGRVEVVSLTLHQPAIQLVEGPAGDLNAETIGGGPDRTPKERPSEGEAPGGPAKILGLLKMDRLQIRDGQVKYFRKAGAGPPGLIHELKDLDLMLTDLGLDKTAKLKISLSVLPSGRLEMEGEAGPITMELRPENVKLSLKSGRSDLSLAGGARDGGWLFDIGAQRIQAKDLIGPLQGALPPGMDLSVLSARVALNGKTARISDLSVKAFDGRIRANAELDLSKEAPAYEGDLEVEGLQIGQALDTFFSPKGMLTGKARMGLKIRGRGKEWEAMAPALRGNGTVEIRDGQIPKSRLTEKIMASIEAVRLGTPQSSVRRGNPLTAFSLLEGRFKIANSVVQWDQLNLSAPDFELKTSGTTGLNKQIDLAGKVSLAQDVTNRISLGPIPEAVLLLEGRFTVPVKITGSFERPRVNVDAKAIGARAKDQLKQDIFDRLFR